MSLLSKVKGKIDYLKREFVLFGYLPADIDLDEIDQHFTYREITTGEILKDLRFDYDAILYEHRFRQSNVFCCFEDQGNVVAYGWINPNKRHYLGELDLEMKWKKEIAVLYDFFTAEAHRGQGLYPSLLQKMCLRNRTPKLIYAFGTNVSSIRGIEKAGFHRLGKLRGFNKRSYERLVQVLWKK